MLSNVLPHSRVGPCPLGSSPVYDRAIVVLGCAVLEDGKPSFFLEQRLERALAEAEAHPNALVIVTGGAVANRFAEGPTMRDWLVRRGVPAQRIWVEDQARHTVGNMQLVRPMLQRAGASQVTLVTSEFHMHRSHALLRAELDRMDMGDIDIQRSRASDGLTERERAETERLERWKEQRDLDTISRRPSTHGLFFNPALFARRSGSSTKAA